MRFNLKNIVLIILFLFVLGTIEAEAVSRFPKPEFESGHLQPEVQKPEARASYMFWVDILVLFAALSLAAYFLLKKRSRKGILWLSLFSILYFGFYKEGCVCSIGAIQNVVLALFNADYAIPISVILVFIIPLLFSVFFGRVFCSGVCPFGALQDLISFRSIKIKPGLDKLLGILPFVYLGFAVLYSATATDFVICRYDPFVGFFRLDATSTMFLIGGLLLLIGIFIAKPYCRFLCPYGALLNLISRFSKHHMTITPGECINCRLCEESCPVEAINFPVSLKEKDSPNVIYRRFVIMAVILPVLVVSGSLIGYTFHENLALANKDVSLAKELHDGTNFGYSDEEVPEIVAYRNSGKSLTEIYSTANNIIDKYKLGSPILGGFIGLVFGLTLIGLTTYRYRSGYEPNKATCVSCGKCMDYCPVKKIEKSI